jgi:hypothetical protein
MSGYFNVFKTVGKILKGNKSKVPTTITSIKPGKNLAKKRKVQDDITTKRSEIHSGYKVSDEQKIELRKKSNQPKINKKIADIYDKKADGGRIGRRFGTPKPKTSVEKIKETFGPKKKNLSPKQMKIAKLAGNPNKIDGADFKKLRNR